jgi:S-formylglutathione hydrolase FrmB
LVVGSWSESDVAGHPAEIFEPAERNPHGYVLIYLHGVHLGRLSERDVFTALLERHGLPVIAPITQRSWWSNRICEEFDSQLTAERHLLDNVVPYIQERWDSKTPQIGLFGTSMGGQGALRFSYKYPDIFPVVAGISPALDYQLRFAQGDETLPLMYRDPEQARQDTALLHIHPLNWPRHQFFCCCPTDYQWIDSADRLRMKLHSLGVPFEHDLETEGGGHGVQYYDKMAEKVIGFLVERLQKERLRVV